MAFPLSPANNQISLVNGIEYIYNSTKGAWYRYGDATANVITANTFQVLGSTASTSNSTGSIIVLGGVGVQGNVVADKIYTDNLYYAANNLPFTGIYGATGSAGVTGATGTAGVNGATGAAGATGVTGTNGTNGTNGATGAAGSNGTNGATGPTGSQGIQGASGVSGASGYVGSDGATGSAGTNGTDGATGPQGASGANYSEAFDQANAAFTQANTSLTTAQAAFDKANTGSSESGAVLTSTVDTFTGDGLNDEFTLTVEPATINYTTAVVGGVTQPRSAYSVVGTLLTFTSIPANNVTIEVTTIGTSNTTLYTVNNILSPFLLMGA